MPTTKPRIIVTLEPEDKAVLDELAAVLGASVSSVVRELIREAVPAFSKTVMVIKQAKTSPAAAFDQMADYMAKIQFQAAQAQLEIQDKRSTLRRGGKRK